jgi:hypothetical protein
MNTLAYMTGYTVLSALAMAWSWRCTDHSCTAGSGATQVHLQQPANPAWWGWRIRLQNIT